MSLALILRKPVVKLVHLRCGLDFPRLLDRDHRIALFISFFGDRSVLNQFVKQLDVRFRNSILVWVSLS